MIRDIGFTIAAVVGVTLVIATLASAQPAPHPTIYRVTMEPGSGVLTVTGTGLGPDLMVTLDGHPVPQLPGATDTQMEVLAPATVLSEPGSYRLTVVDPVRQVGDGFVVSSPAAAVFAGVVARSEPPPEGIPAAVIALASPPVPPLLGGPSPLVIENSGPPYNAAVGFNALAANTSGSENAAIGFQALRLNTSGSRNTASGFEALRGNTSGSDNVANGHQALYVNTIGLGNNAIGVKALYSNTTGNRNTANGSHALYSNSTGFNNTASGNSALNSNTTGSSNTAVGLSAGYSQTTGSYNITLGAEVLGAAADTNTIRIGRSYDSGTGVGQNQAYFAGIRGTAVTGGEVVFVDATGKLGSGAIVIGANSVGSAEVIDASLTGSDLAPDAVGTAELAADAVTAAKVAFNYAASTSEGGPAADVACVGCVSASEVGFSFASLGPNTFTGTQAIGAGNLSLVPSAATGGNLTKDGLRFLHDFGVNNTFLGINAGNFSLTGTSNAAIGADALSAITTGGGNTASGYGALKQNTIGLSNTATGVVALNFNTSGQYNTATGASALQLNTTGNWNTASGASTLENNISGAFNVGSGAQVLYSNTAGSRNTASGFQALALNSTGSSNTAVGAEAGSSQTSGSYNIALGAAVIGLDTDANTMRLGLPYDGSGTGQNRTFIAGIHGTQLTGPAVQVFVDVNGQLGTLTAPIASGTGTTAPAPPALEQQVLTQQAIIEDLLARIARLEAAAKRSRRQ